MSHSARWVLQHSSSSDSLLRSLLCFPFHSLLASRGLKHLQEEPKLGEQQLRVLANCSTLADSSSQNQMVTNYRESSEEPALAFPYFFFSSVL